MKPGCTSRDGIGAVVSVTAGGVTQMRIQDGGVHHRGQNHARLHFGLEKNLRVEKISVHWPSGVVQELVPGTVNAIVEVREPEAGHASPPAGPPDRR